MSIWPYRSSKFPLGGGGEGGLCWPMVYMELVADFHARGFTRELLLSITKKCGS